MIYFNCKVNVFWSIDDVYVMIFLEIGCCCWLDGNIMFSFLFYEVSCWFIIVNFISFMDFISKF